MDSSPRAPSRPSPLGREAIRSDAGADELEKALRWALEKLRGELGCPRVSVTLAAAAGDVLRLKVLAGDEIEVGPASRTGEPGVYLTGLRNLEHPTTVGDLRQEEDLSLMDRSLRDAGYRSYAHYPVSLPDGRCITLNAISRQAGFFDEGRIAIFRSHAASVRTLTWYLLTVRRHEQQANVLALAHAVIHEIGSIRGLRDTAAHLTRRLAEHLDFDRAVLYLANTERSWLTCEASIGLPEGSPEQGSALLPSVQIEAGSALDLALRGGPLLLDRPEEVLDLPPEVTGRLGPGETQQVLVLPLTQGENAVGLLLGLWTRQKPLSFSNELDAMSLLGQQIGLILQSRRSLDHQERSVRNFAELLDMSQAVASVPDLRNIPELVATRARDLCEADEAMLFLIEPDRRSLRPAVCIGAYEQEVMQIRVPMGQGITGTVAARREGEIINHAESDPRSVHIPGTPVEPEAILAAPLVCADRLIGVLTLSKLEGRCFEPIDLDTVEIFCSQAAIALDNVRLFTGIQEERTRLVAMLQHMEDGVIFAEKRGEVLLINESARRILDLDERDWTGVPLTELLESADCPEVREALNRVRDEGEANVTQEFGIGGLAYLCSVSAIRTEEEHAGEVLLFHNVSELKEIEARLLQSSKMLAVGQLAAGVAHEFNNLIAAISGYAQLMKQNRDGSMVEKGVNVILRSSQRARELTSCLLTFSRRKPGRREAVDLNELLDDTLLLLSRQFEKFRIRVHRERGALPTTVADAGQLQQVFLNILINAQQALEGGGNLWIRSEVSGASVSFSFRDDGPGIDREHLPRIFDPFFTTRGPLSGGKMRGTGLGLSTAYNIVREHGGTLGVESAPGEGAAFTVRLPVRSQEDRPPVAPGPALPPSLQRSGRILVSETDAALAGTVREILEGIGHQVRGEPRVDEIPRLVRQWGADLLILGYGAVDDDPVGMLKRIRGGSDSFPVLFVTTRASLIEVEGDPWVFRLSKPFRNRDLTSLVNRVLSFGFRRAS